MSLSIKEVELFQNNIYTLLKKAFFYYYSFIVATYAIYPLEECGT